MNNIQRMTRTSQWKFLSRLHGFIVSQGKEFSLSDKSPRILITVFVLKSFEIWIVKTMRYTSEPFSLKLRQVQVRPGSDVLKIPPYSFMLCQTMNVGRW